MKISRADQTDRSMPVGRVLGFAFGHWRRHLLLALGLAGAVILATLTDVWLPRYAGALVAAITHGHDQRALNGAVAAFTAMAVLGLVQVVLRYCAFLGVVNLSLVTMKTAAEEAFWRVQRMSADWHADNFAGAVVRRVTRGIWALCSLNETLLMSLFPALVVLVGSAVALGIRWPLMGVIVAVGAVVFTAISGWLATRWVGPAAQLSNAWDSRMGGALSDAITCNAVVKSFGAEAREDETLRRIMDRWRGRSRRAWQRGSVAGTVQAGILLALRSAITGLAMWFWWYGKASPGDVTTVLTTYFIVLGYMRDVGFHIANLQRSVNEMEEMVALHGEKLGIEDRPGAGPIAIADGHVVFEEVGFRYGESAPLFDGLTLAIRPGDRVGLVGPSGSGKSTFIKLIRRLHEPDRGRILIDGQDIAAHTQASLRRQIAVVAQEPVLFHRSVIENIAYGKPGATRAEVEQAALLANAHDFIARLPRGYNTIVGERGVKLSGGERQRVAIARAFLADAPILILDEATASLDSESEALIQEAMERLMLGRTVIVIAHRLATVRSLDRILVFDRGRIVEEGPHAALLSRKGGLYRRLFERQQLAA